MLSRRLASISRSNACATNLLCAVSLFSLTKFDIPFCLRLIIRMTSWLGLTPVLLAWIGGLWLCRELAARQKIYADWRLSVALATALWGALLTLIVEGLSLGNSLNRPGLFAAWSMADAVVLLAAIKLARQREAISLRLLRLRMSEARQALDRLPLFAKCCWTGIVLIAAFLFGIAATTPTTNWDSLTYHLPRVMHWLQQQSVEHFPTENTRQIEFGPWAAFVSAHLFSLEGTDRLVNLPQWFAMGLTILLLGLFVELLGKCCGIGWCLEESSAAQRKRQNAGGLAALFGVTVPMGMMQALTPQTDYVTTLWIVCLHIFGLAWFREPENGVYVLAAAMAFGLGVLTKSTAVIYAAPLVLFAVAWLLTRRASLVWKLKVAVAFSLVVFLLNAPHNLRNYALFKSPLGSAEIQKMVRNQRTTHGTIASNLIRNLALHNNCGVRFITRALNHTALVLHALTGEKIDDPRTTYPPGPVKFFDQFLVYDDYASAPVHLLVIMLAMVLALRQPRRNARLLGYAGSICASFLLFVALLKYQDWNGRFHLAYLVLFSPFVALVLLDMAPRWSHLLTAVSVYAYALVCLRVSEARPIFHPRFVSLPRESQYLDIHGSPWNAPLQCIADEIMAADCRTVGLKLGFDAFEYPIWMMLRNRGFAGRIDHYYRSEERRVGK